MPLSIFNTLLLCCDLYQITVFLLTKLILFTGNLNGGEARSQMLLKWINPGALETQTENYMKYRLKDSRNIFHSYGTCNKTRVSIMMLAMQENVDSLPKGRKKNFTFSLLRRSKTNQYFSKYGQSMWNFNLKKSVLRISSHAPSLAEDETVSATRYFFWGELMFSLAVNSLVPFIFDYLYAARNHLLRSPLFMRT